MQTKYKVLSGIMICVTVFAFGRYTAPVVIKTETVEVEKKTESSSSDLDKHKETTKKEVVNADGSKETTTTTTEDTSHHKDKKETDSASKSDKTEIVKAKDSVTISALGAVIISAPTTMYYGLQVSKPMLGPIVVGAFAFTDGRAGVSVGLQF